MTAHPFDPSLATKPGAARRCAICGATEFHPDHGPSPASKLKQDIRAGLITALDALDNEHAANLMIGVLLGAQPDWGPGRASRVCEDLDIHETRHVRSLRWDELNRLEALLRGDHGQAAA